MSNIVVKTHDFEEAKEGLKKFSERTMESLELSSVNNHKSVGEWFGNLFTGGGIGRKHTVTGEEFNILVQEMQEHLIKINNMHIDFVKEIKHVYLALEALDKDYIQAILISLKSTEKTSEGLKVAQDRISVIVEDQRKTLEILKKHKQKLDAFSHLCDIDNLWNRCEGVYLDIERLASVVSDEKKNLEQLEKEVESYIKKLDTVYEFTNSLEKILHLQDVDEMWESLLNARKKLDALISDVDDLEQSIKQHQKNIEKMQSDILTNSQSIETIEKENLSIRNIIADNQKNVDQAIAVMESNHAETIKLINSVNEKQDKDIQAIVEVNETQDKDIQSIIAINNEQEKTIQSQSKRIGELELEIEALNEKLKTKGNKILLIATSVASVGALILSILHFFI
jgi:DNA repair exonuclease SbcCD ATPase subunit